MAGWMLDTQYQALDEDFGSLEAVFALQGERLTKDPLSEVIRIERAGVRYYVKRYWGGGKGLRRYIGRPRVKAEWQNLKYFAKWGVATAPIVAFGLERQFGRFARGALITREISNTEDLGTVSPITTLNGATCWSMTGSSYFSSIARQARSGGGLCCVIASSRTWPAWIR